MTTILNNIDWLIVKRLERTKKRKIAQIRASKRKAGNKELSRPWSHEVKNARTNRPH